jgi:hypothetical protein
MRKRLKENTGLGSPSAIVAEEPALCWPHMQSKQRRAAPPR